MSDSEDSIVTYTEASPSPDYVPNPEHPPSPVYVPYVSEPVYLEFMPPEDEVFPAEEQPLHAVVSPTADSPRYIADSDPEEDTEEDPEEDPVDYPVDGEDDDDDDDGLFDDDEDEDDDVEEDEDKEEEEDNPASIDSVPPHVHRVTARMSIRDQTPISLPPKAEVERLLALPTPPPSPLTPLSSPLPQIPSPPLLVSPPLPTSPPPLPTSPTHPLGYRAAMIRLRAEAPSTSYPLPLPPPSGTPPSGTPPLLSIPVPTSSPPFLLPSTDRRADRPEICLLPRKRMCIALGPRYEIRESSSAPTARPTGGFRVNYGFVATFDRKIRRDPERDVGYGITDTWDEMVEAIQEVPTTDVAELSQRMTDFVTTVRQDTNKIYVRLDKAHEARAVLNSRLNLLGRDRRSHAYTALLMEREARLSREAWRWSMEASDTARSEVMALRTTVLGQQTEIAALRAADRARQAQLVETRRLMSTLQTQVTALQRQQGPASGPVQPDVPEEAGSST
ncbi:hypothetical protein Tco_0599972 [Tanacetum coccineum]